MNLPDHVHVVAHPLVQRKLAIARDKATSSESFRRLLGQIAMLMAYEITRHYPVESLQVQTPLAMASGVKLRRGITLVPILRAGLAMADGILDLIPQAKVGHLGIYRDEVSLRPVVYYNKLPAAMAETDVILIDPMLATGGSCVSAIEAIKHVGAKSIKLLCLVAAPEGIGHLAGAHPDVPIYTAAVDSHLNTAGYIVPGLGDAGDRVFGTL